MLGDRNGVSVQKSLQLKHNLTRYAWYKIFTKRVYLPLITIQLVSVGHVSIKELTVIVVVSSITQALLQVPAGYAADKIGNKQAAIIGAAIALPSPLFYAFMPNFAGGLIASVLFFAGLAFQLGAVEALVHDTLVAMRRQREYSKVVGRAQTYGLAGNIILIAAVPLSYHIHHTLPFLIGFVLSITLLWLMCRFYTPPPMSKPLSSDSPKRMASALRQVFTIKNVLLFIFAGFLSGVANKGGEFRELLFQSIHIGTEWFGIIAAVGSMCGAAAGWYVHYLDRLRPLWFYLFDLVIMAGSVASMGITKQPLTVVAAATIFAAYTRVRMIIFQAKLLDQLSHVYKATLLSSLNIFMAAGDILVITLLTQAVTATDYSAGYIVFGGLVLLIGIIMWMMIAVTALVLPK